jgi:hypothetical protein
MVSTTLDPHARLRSFGRTRAIALGAVVLLIAGAAALTLFGCTGGTGTTSSGSVPATGSVGANMAGPAANVVVTKAAIDNTPKRWDLKTPQSAVRSYLDWTSYAYRIATSNVASQTMTGDELARVDSYIQFNLEKSRLIDQTLSSITFGAASSVGTTTVIPTKEKWTYSYISIKAPGGAVLGGPYTASYNVSYALVKQGDSWVVVSVTAKAIGAVK